MQEIRVRERQEDQPVGYALLHEHVRREALLCGPQQAQGVLPSREGHPGVTGHLPGRRLKVMSVFCGRL